MDFLTRFVMLLALFGTVGLRTAPASQPSSGDLLSPVRVIAAGAPLDVQGFGHAAPFVGDFDGDGAQDLLVGQFQRGQLRVYRNTGSNAERRFSEHVLFQDGAENGRVPAG